MIDPLSPTFAAAGLVAPPEKAGGSLPADPAGRPRPGQKDVLADARALARVSFASAWRGAPGEIAWGRFVDARA
ncbi:hypothetical protein [Desulfolutivibrio sulfoxidireducens]|uniref:hypothetical protein n=1 Tax=Desulfolutivibrio sulfoxidireducens TaxID=2773299 RepID=UPI00159E00C2|nr:hypothetical protein [Desulfolutivibrio sulfoxidireducens]QLA17842.1 hypothetical protein GD605_18020 [Desulfolutivibrio sulfoxidireducens]QLA21422.1 hypothetical protein GD604_17650 [Desulfolutivibrio sulfoxidireducens]